MGSSPTPAPFGGLMHYNLALQEAERVGAANAKGLPLLAQTLWTLSRVHAINPEMAYNGAVKLGYDAKAVRRLAPVELGDLMFVE